jgi:hypothetical protein
MSGPMLTRREEEALRHLDFCCWEDSEQGGGGWCDIRSFARSFGVGYCWSSQLLGTLSVRELVEGRRGRLKQYAPTAQGAAFLADLDMVRPTLDEYRERLRGLTNAELVELTGAEILGAAVLESRGRGGGFTDDCVGACYDEAQRRGNIDLYKRGHNEALRSQGHHRAQARVSTPLSFGEPERVGGK